MKTLKDIFINFSYAVDNIDTYYKIAAIDPTSDVKTNKYGKYLNILIELYKSDKDLLFNKRITIKRRLKKLDTLIKIKKLDSTVKNNIKTLKDLLELVDPFTEEQLLSNSQKEKIIKSNGAIKCFETTDWEIISPITKEGAIYYGKGTKWCTSAKNNNAFDKYNKEAPLYININLKNSHKYQLTFGDTPLFADERDRVKTSKEIIKLLPKSILKWYVDNVSGAAKIFKSVFEIIIVNGTIYPNLFIIEKNFKYNLYDRKKDKILLTKDYDWIYTIGDHIGVVIDKKQNIYSYENQEFVLDTFVNEIVTTSYKNLYIIRNNNRANLYDYNIKSVIFPQSVKISDIDSDIQSDITRDSDPDLYNTKGYFSIKFVKQRYNIYNYNTKQFVFDKNYFIIYAYIHNLFKIKHCLNSTNIYNPITKQFLFDTFSSGFLAISMNHRYFTITNDTISLYDSVKRKYLIQKMNKIYEIADSDFFVIIDNNDKRSLYDAKTETYLFTGFTDYYVIKDLLIFNLNYKYLLFSTSKNKLLLENKQSILINNYPFFNIINGKEKFLYNVNTEEKSEAIPGTITNNAKFYIVDHLKIIKIATNCQVLSSNNEIFPIQNTNLVEVFVSKDHINLYNLDTEKLVFDEPMTQMIKLHNLLLLYNNDNQINFYDMIENKLVFDHWGVLYDYCKYGESRYNILSFTIDNEDYQYIKSEKRIIKC